jgi:hypothetical protein
MLARIIFFDGDAQSANAIFNGFLLGIDPFKKNGFRYLNAPNMGSDIGYLPMLGFGKAQLNFTMMMDPGNGQIYLSRLLPLGNIVEIHSDTNQRFTQSNFHFFNPISASLCSKYSPAEIGSQSGEVPAGTQADKQSNLISLRGCKKKGME